MRLCVVVVLVALSPAIASAGPTLDRIRSEGVLHCGASIRPGLAFPARDGTWHGLEVDICHAMAVAALGPAAQFTFQGYTVAPHSYDRVRDGANAVSFLTASEILAQNLLPATLPGPAVFYSTSGVMVQDPSPAQSLADLRGHRICAEPGTGPERSLNAWYAAHQIPFHYFQFQEPEEMLDGFYSGRCDAMANDITSLAALRLQAEADGHPSRILAEPLAAVPILAITPRSDSDWSAIVAWTVATLIGDDSAGAPGPGGGSQPLPLAGASLGLADGWQNAVIATTGHYGDIFRRNLGDASPLELPRGLNALWNQGGLMCPSFTE